ncbi:universal stress protein (plasmid) [Natrinema zhouii]|uniref:universal stress protein n=1 Tax=Natrinema zhouii TaxID=1710539 RepID=UPI001CFFB00E|nr:universal stress protein [Natrinema zhouii]UHQ98751.1 universal stress protein [Natrinema zhouii]
MYEIVAGIGTNEEWAVEQAKLIIELATSGLTTDVTLLHVFEDNPEGASAHQLESVKAARDQLTDHGVDVDVRESSGDPAQNIVEFARERDRDAICVAGRKRSPSGKVLFGSVTQSVLLESDRPVFVPGVEK